MLEHIFPEDWLEHKGRYAFLLGVIYSVIGILIASVLFPGDPALVAVAFTSLLLLPELYKIFSIEERQEAMEQKVSIKALWRDDIDLIKVYVFLFLGILLVYSIGTILLPSFQTNMLFREQLEIRLGQGFAGSATAGIFSPALFIDLLNNNFLVLMACFILALLTGDGAIFLITWNASVWGTIFGFTAKNAALFSGTIPAFLFMAMMVIVFFHLIVEGISYFLAAISGSVISKDVLLERFASRRFLEVFGFNMYLLLFALLFLVVGGLIETVILTVAIPIPAFALFVGSIFGFLLLVRFLLPKTHRTKAALNPLFLYFFSFLISLAIMAILGFPTFGFGDITYQEIIRMSFLAMA